VTLDLLATGATRLGIVLDPVQVGLLERYVELLLAANQRINLTRIVEPDEIERRHLLDALTVALPCLDALRSGVPWWCLDVGSGGGVPGIPLAIVFPSLRVTLLESVGKKAAFLRDAVAELGLSQVTVRAERAEDAARDPAERHHQGVAVALELCLPFVRPSGILVLPRGSDLDAQRAGGEEVAGLLAARLRPPIPLDVPELPPGRRLIVADKLGPTPKRFPRRAGMAAKNPLARSQASGVRRQ